MSYRLATQLHFNIEINGSWMVVTSFNYSTNQSKLNLKWIRFKKKMPAVVFTYDGGPARRRCCRCCRFYGPGWINPDGIVTGPVWFWCGVRTRSTPWTVTLLRELYAGTPVAVYSDRWSLSCSSWWLLQLLMNSLYLCRWWRHWAARSAVCHSSTTLSTWRRWRHHLTPPQKKTPGWY